MESAIPIVDLATEVIIGKTIRELGYTIYATKSTATALNKTGITKQAMQLEDVKSLKSYLWQYGSWREL